MTAEILSIIAVCISGLTAVCSASVPAILNYKMKKAELAERRKREEQQEYEAKFEVFYQSHLKILTEFSKLYVCLKNDPSAFNKSSLIAFVSNLAVQFRDNIQTALTDFNAKVKDYSKGNNLDEEYKSCLNLILKSFGVRVSGYTPNIIMPDMLKIALKEQFEQLQNSTTSDLRFFRN